MKPHMIVRISGVVGIVGAYGIYVLDGGMLYAMALTIAAILLVVAPDVADRFPIGPSR